MKIEPISAQSWLVKFGLGLALPLLVYAAIAAVGPKAPPLPTVRDGALEALDRYTQGPVPDVVLVGSSFTARLKEEYFDVPNLKVLGLSGGSSITALKVVMGRERLPKIVLIEMNVLDRSEDPALVQRFTGGSDVNSPARSNRPWRFMSGGFMRHPIVAKPARWLRQCFRPGRAISIIASMSIGKCGNGPPQRLLAT